MLRNTVTRTTQVKSFSSKLQDMTKKWNGSNIFVKTFKMSMKQIVVLLC